MQAALLQDLQCVSEFVEGQGALGRDITAVLQLQANSMLLKLKQLKGLTMRDATSFTTAISTGPWAPEQKSSLGECIGALATSGVGAVKVRRKMQSLVHLENYLTNAEWEQLQTKTLVGSKVNMIAARLWTLGIACPSEPTLHKAASIACQSERISTTDFDGYKKQLQQEVKRLDKTQAWMNIERVVKFPPSPKELPLEVYQYAYSNEEPIDCPLRHMTTSLSKMCKSKGSTHALGNVFESAPADSSASTRLAIQDLIAATVADHLAQLPRSSAPRSASASASSWEAPPTRSASAGSWEAPPMTPASFVRDASPSPPVELGTSSAAAFSFKPVCPWAAPATPAASSLTPSALTPATPADPALSLVAPAASAHGARESLAIMDKVMGDAMFKEEVVKEKGTEDDAAIDKMETELLDAYARAKAKAKAVPKAKTTAAPKSAVLKRPASAAKSRAVKSRFEKPTCPDITGEQPGPIYYMKNGRILTSLAKQSFRVFTHKGQRVEYSFSFAD